MAAYRMHASTEDAVGRASSGSSGWLGIYGCAPVGPGRLGLAVQHGKAALSRADFGAEADLEWQHVACSCIRGQAHGDQVYFDGLRVVYMK